MATRKWSNRVRCLNCGSTVHWTTFQCDVCGRNPREREPIKEIDLPEQVPMAPHIERRRYRRYGCRGKVILNRSFRGELIDLCQRGAKLKTVLHLFHNEVVQLDFAVNGIPVRIKARVVHVKRGVFDDRSTLGVCFEAITRDHHEILTHYIQALSEEKPMPTYVA